MSLEATEAPPSLPALLNTLPGPGEQGNVQAQRDLLVTPNRTAPWPSASQITKPAGANNAFELESPFIESEMYGHADLSKMVSQTPRRALGFASSPLSRGSRKDPRGTHPGRRDAR